VIRTFRSATADATTLVHDPRTGLTHRADRPLAPARLQLDDTAVATWPVVPAHEIVRSQPLSLCWSPIVRCNLECPYCLDDKTVAEASGQSRRRIATILAGSGVLGVDISGGEPLLLRDLPALADILTDGGLVVSVTTNGWHLTRRVNDVAGHVDAVRVSLDGPSAKIHDGNRRSPGSFDRAVDGIRAAIAAGIPCQVQTVLMASTAAHAQDMVDLADDLGAGGLTFLQHLPIGDAAGNCSGEAISDDMARALIARLCVPTGLTIRLRERTSAGGFTVVRADGKVYRNADDAEHIAALRPLTTPADLDLRSTPDGSA